MFKGFANTGQEVSMLEKDMRLFLFWSLITADR